MLTAEDEGLRQKEKSLRLNKSCDAHFIVGIGKRIKCS